MQREIKFRAWDRRHKEMLLPDSGHRLSYQRVIGYAETIARDWGVNARGELFLLADSIWYPEQTNFVLMQYTGLKDENGVEIYEGDVLTCIWCDCGDDYTHLVEYEGACFYAGTHKLQEFEFEIIGNIHQNPELLNTTERSE